MNELKLTKKDEQVLSSALYFEKYHGAGIGPRYGAQFKQYRKLENLNLLKFVDWGCDICGETESEVMVYELTDLGRKLAKE